MYPISCDAQYRAEGGDMIRRVKAGYQVQSESGKNMGTYKTEAEAKKRLRQIEYFKHRKK
jgi:hypothetical protein